MEVKEITKDDMLERFACEGICEECCLTHVCELSTNIPQPHRKVYHYDEELE